MARGGREALGAVSALGAYAASALPLTRRELRRWRPRAEAIADPGLRRLAVAALTEKSANVEAVTVFATLAPLRERGRVVRAIAALQVSIDFLDSVEEAAASDLAASQPTGLETRQAYLAELDACWRREVAALPAGAALLPRIEAAIQRCAEGQRWTHAAAAADPPDSNAFDLAYREELRSSVEGGGEPGGAEYRWWELAAGASSSVAAHALIAAAASAATTASEADSIDAAYFPPIGALTVLLDDLVDLAEDRAAGEHNYLDYYADPAEAAERLGAIGAAGSAALSGLRRRDRHAAILAGVAAFYLSEPAAETAFARPIRDRLLAALGPGVPPLVAFVRLRRRF